MMTRQTNCKADTLAIWGPGFGRSFIDRAEAREQGFSRSRHTGDRNRPGYDRNLQGCYLRRRPSTPMPKAAAIQNVGYRQRQSQSEPSALSLTWTFPKLDPSGKVPVFSIVVPDRHLPKTQFLPMRFHMPNRCSAIGKSDIFFLFSPKSGCSFNFSGRVCAVTNVSARTGVPRSDLAVRLPSCSANAIRGAAELKLVRRP